MEKVKGGYKVEINLPDTVAGFIVTFKNKEYTDDSDGLGYWVPMYNSEGVQIQGANAERAASLVVGGWGSDLDMTKFSDTLLTFYEKEFNLYPEKRKRFLIFLSLCLKKSKDLTAITKLKIHC